MERIGISALVCAFLLTTTAQADDLWDKPDAISKTVLAQREAQKEGREDKASEEQREADRNRDSANLRDRGREEAEAAEQSQAKWYGVGVEPLDNRDAGGGFQVRDHSAPAIQQRASAAPERDTRTSNLLGPLWGVPQDAPVMREIDPELEMQYARDSQGRLVPREEMTAADRRSVEQREREQRQAEREAQFERERQERAAKAEAKQREKELRAEQKQMEREARDAERNAERATERNQRDSREIVDESEGDSADREESASQRDEETRAAAEQMRRRSFLD